MKFLLTTINLLLLSMKLLAQQNYEPEILILSPHSVTYDSAFKYEISEYNSRIKEKAKAAMKFDSIGVSKEPGNIQRITAAEFGFAKGMDFAKQVSYISEKYLIYKFFEKFPNLLILLKDRESPGGIEEMQRIAIESKMQYVLNFPSLSFYREDGLAFAKLGVQLFDDSTGTFLIDTSYVGTWNNPGFEFACRDSSLSCTINNSVSQAIDQVIREVASNSPTLRMERRLWKDRLRILEGDYYLKPFDKSIVLNAIPKSDSNISVSNLYQLLVSSDSTKFVGFFLEQKDKPGLEDLSEKGTDHEIQIVTGKSINDTGYLNEIPGTYAYIVRAVKYQGKWYYEKSKVTYFQPEDGQKGKLQYFNNLQEWGFFKDRSTEFDPNFWETNLFKKVRDLRKDPDWPKYGKTIWKSEEEENRSFIGLYEIVADQLKSKGNPQVKTINMN